MLAVLIQEQAARFMDYLYAPATNFSDTSGTANKSNGNVHDPKHSQPRSTFLVPQEVTYHVSL